MKALEGEAFVGGESDSMEGGTNEKGEILGTKEENSTAEFYGRILRRSAMEFDCFRPLF